MKKLFALFTVLLLAACGKGHERYEGYWKMENVSFQYLIQIQKADESTYLLKDDVLGGSDSSQVLSQRDKGMLTFSGGEELILSDDGNTLRVGKAAYRRIDDAEAAALQEQAKQEIARQKAIAEENRRRCDANTQAYLKEKKARGNSVKNDVELALTYGKKALAIPNCRPPAD